MELKRREFILGATALGAVRTFGIGAKDKVRMAFVGIGNRGLDNFNMFAYYRDQIEVVAVCDTQLGAEHTLAVLKQCPEAKRYVDWRKMLEECAGGLDAVCVSTPDFSHFPIAMAVMEAGLALYCEKPLGNTFREIELMAAVAARKGVVTQMGNQGHSDGNYWQFRELVGNGWLKDVRKIVAFMNSSRRWHKWNGTMKTMPRGGGAPANLAWDEWLAQRPVREFDMNYINGEWRSFYEFGNGTLGDWGAHLFDAPHEFLQLGLPTRIEVKKCEGATPVVFPMASTLVFHFGDKCVLEWRDGVGNEPEPVAQLTAKYKRAANGVELHLADERVLARLSHGATMRIIAGADPRDAQVRKALTTFPREKSNHYLNFLNAVRGVEKPNSPFAVAAPLSQVFTLGCIAQRRGVGVLHFDPVSKKFSNDSLANEWLAGPTWRKEWIKPNWKI